LADYYERIIVTAIPTQIEPQKAPFNIPSLDGLRTVAFVIVFFSHSSDLGDRFFPGGLGVTIFFFLSGYLITTLMRRESERKGSINFKSFYMRRILRIFPPFYAVFAIGLLLTAIGVLTDPPTWAAISSQLLYYANYRMAFVGFEGFYSGSSIIWSLAVEEHFYFLFPFLYWGMLRLKLSRSVQAYSIWGLCALTLLWRLVLVFAFVKPGLLPAEYLEYASDTRFDSMLFGCALAVHGNPALDLGGAVTDSRWRSWGIPASLGLLLLSLVVRDPVFRMTLRYTVQGVALYPIFICAIRYADWGPFRWLNLAWVKKLGQLSYLLYLIHFSVLSGLSRYFPRIYFPLNQGEKFQSNPLDLALYIVLAFGISLALAFALHYAVERPALKLKHRFSS
jgi:peptidoglycan/LPS O-acetylase OafA/YrhL